MREVIHRSTNKVEQYNALEDWVRFAGGGIMYAHAFEEQEKLVKYTGLLTNCLILDNTLEISAALNTLAAEGYRPSRDELAALSPYQTRLLKRFGDYGGMARIRSWNSHLDSKSPKYLFSMVKKKFNRQIIF
jgi:hypothetical protein